MQIIIGIIVFLFVLGLAIKILELVWKLFQFLLGLGVIIILAGLAIYFYPITLSILGILIVLGIFMRISEKRSIKKWYKRSVDAMTHSELDKMFIELVDYVKSEDDNVEEYKFDINNLPYGRINAFLNYFDVAVQNEEVYYFSAIQSMNNKEIREYGTCITKSGIYFSKQYETTSEEKPYLVESTYMPFESMTKVNTEKGEFVVDYINVEDKAYESIKIPTDMTSINNNRILTFNDYLIKEDIPLMYKKEKILTVDYANQSIDDAEKRFLNNIDKESIAGVTGVAGVVATGPGMVDSFNENMNYMNGARGGGYAAEYGNNTVDRALGRETINAAQNLDPVTGGQVKHGADRIVNGVSVQTKYYKTASESIGAAFEHKQSLYHDGGDMMQIEVPKDQYHKALDLMQKRIDSGQVKGAQPGDSPEKYVRKGHFTYVQANNIAIAGTVESLSVDVLNGAVICTQAGGISAVIAFSVALWKGHSLEDAAKVGLSTGMKVLGKGTVIYTLSMQLSRDKLVNPFAERIFTADGILKSAGYVNNPVFSVTDQLATTIKNSDVAKTELGKAMGLDTLTSKTIVAGGVTAAVVFGPDMCRALTGRISGKQLFKNSAVGASGIGGSLVGQALIPIPVVGAVVGGAVAGFIAKTTLDSFIEDDAIYMFQVLKEEFLDVVMVSDLTQEEFDLVVTETISHKKLNKLLMDMYASDECRSFAREAIVTVSVTNVLSSRKIISNDDFYESYSVLLEATA